MVTIYDLLEVSESASKEEIEQSYQRLVIEYQTDPILTEEENKKNELILNKLKIAYEILVNDEKRDKYDRDLSKKRAEELIKKIPERKTEESVSDAIKKSNINNTDEENTNDSKMEITDYDEIPKAKNTREKSGGLEEDVVLSKEEQKKIRKAAQKEFNENLKKVQKAEEEYSNAYNEAYKKYMKKMGYDVNETSVLKKIRNVLIVCIVIILICLIAWIIPPIRKILLNIYEDNIVIKSFVDIVGALIKSITSVFE